MSQTRKITVTSITPIKTFTNKNGNESTIYEVFAVGEDGAPIDLTLRSFDELPDTGELIEVEVTPYHHEKYGTSYTLKPVGGGGGGGQSAGARLGPKVDELRKRLDGLESRIERLESGASELGGPPGGQPADDDDIPF